MRKILLLAACLLLATPVLGQEPPNGFQVVLGVHTATGDLINRDSTAFTDQACRELAVTDARWGRKVRRDGDWGSRNADAIAYRFDKHKRMVDIVGSSSDPGGPPSPNARPQWSVRPFSEDNGYWMACGPSPTPVEPPPAEPLPPPDMPPLILVLEQLNARVTELTAKVEALSKQLEEQRAWPIYRGNHQWLGTFTLTPQEPPK